MATDRAVARAHWKLAWDFCDGEHGYNETTGEPSRPCIRCEGLAAAFARLDMAARAAERTRCVAIVEKSEALYTRLMEEHDAKPESEYHDARTKGELVSTFAHIAHECHDLAAALAREGPDA